MKKSKQMFKTIADMEGVVYCHELKYDFMPVKTINTMEVDNIMEGISKE